MLGRKKGASKNKPLDNSQRTLLDLFPIKKLGKGSSDHTPSESQDSEKCNSDVERGAVSDGIPPVDLPPSSPMALSEASSAPSVQPIIIDEGESECHSATLDDDEIRCLSPGGSQEDPIVIRSSPQERREPPKQLWSIFTPRIKEPESAIPIPKRLPKSDLFPPFPDAESQHVRGAQTTFSARLAFSRRSSGDVDVGNSTDVQGGIRAFLCDDSCCDCRLELKVRACASEDDKATYLSAIPKEHKECHPAVDNAMSSGASTTTCQLWTDKWRPRRAAQVLGNEQSALYLRDWLKALTLDLRGGGETNDPNRKGKGTRSVKRQRVVRAVDKKRERKRRRLDSEDEDDSWIVYDNESEEEIVSDDVDELNLRQPGDNTDTPSSHGTVYTFEQLTNTIVLTGPPGSGKTACVYACAEELNWDVFEVYPGIGKRSGASLESMIGDVGKNHLVRTAGLPRATIPTARSEGDGGGNMDRRARSLSRDFGFLESTESGQSDGSTMTPRQSLVLLEEVDILFKEDTNFWPTVVNFLRDCKRPVVCTCNDMSLIPSTDLPLQNVLVFQPCPSPVAVSYLQAICCNEGWSVDPEPLTQLYETWYEDEDEDGVHLSTPDLRRTLHRVQLWCTTSHDNPHTDGHEPTACSPDSRPKESDQQRKANIVDEDHDWLKRALEHSEALSFLDSEMKWLQGSGEIRVGDNGEGGTCYDERRQVFLEEERTYGYADRSTVISSTATRLARGRARGGEDLFSSAREVFRARVDYQRQIGKGLGKYVPETAAGQRRTEVYTEYGPYVRQMIVAEDDEERRWTAEREGSGGRRTRNSNRYSRIIAVSMAERRLLGI